jgi:hypothetical protein
LKLNIDYSVLTQYLITVNVLKAFANSISNDIGILSLDNLINIFSSLSKSNDNSEKIIENYLNYINATTNIISAFKQFKLINSYAFNIVIENFSLINALKNNKDISSFISSIKDLLSKVNNELLLVKNITGITSDDMSTINKIINQCIDVIDKSVKSINRLIINGSVNSSNYLYYQSNIKTLIGYLFDFNSESNQIILNYLKSTISVTC